MKIIDSYPGLLQLSAAVQEYPGQLYPLWEEYLNAWAPELKKLIIDDSEPYDFETEIEPVLLVALITQKDKLKIAHDCFVASITRAERNFEAVFHCPGEIRIYFYCGLCNGAGWATTVGGQKAVLLGIEKIIELSWHTQEEMDALLSHELCHIAHSLLRGQDIGIKSSEESQAIWQLYTEGFAQRYEQALIGIEGYYHQDKNGWLSWCQSNRSIAAKEFLHRIDSGASARGFFGDWVSFLEHSYVGYYLGCEFIRSLENNFSVEEIARLNLDQVRALTRHFLHSISWQTKNGSSGHLSRIINE